MVNKERTELFVKNVQNDVSVLKRRIEIDETAPLFMMQNPDPIKSDIENLCDTICKRFRIDFPGEDHLRDFENFTGLDNLGNASYPEMKKILTKIEQYVESYSTEISKKVDAAHIVQEIKNNRLKAEANFSQKGTTSDLIPQHVIDKIPSTKLKNVCLETNKIHPWGKYTLPLLFRKIIENSINLKFKMEEQEAKINGLSLEKKIEECSKIYLDPKFGKKLDIPKLFGDSANHSIIALTEDEIKEHGSIIRLFLERLWY